MIAPPPTVAQYMTSEPATADLGISLADAQERMVQNNIRHLVVLEDGQIAGVISSRDIAVALGVKGASRRDLIVADAMTDFPYVCRTTTSLAEVAEQMEHHRWGCVIVIDADEDDGVDVAVGIFTTTDALRALHSLISGKPAEPMVKPRDLPQSEPQPRRPLRFAHLRAIEGGLGRHQAAQVATSTR